MSEELSREEVVSAIDQAVEDLLGAAGVIGPHIDAVALAQKHLGLNVCVDHREQPRGRGRRVRGERQVLLPPDQSEEQKQWTVAHAIGEHLKPELLGRLGLPPEQRSAMMGESLANLFASRLLVPTPWLQNEVRTCDFDLLELKRRFPTAGSEVIALRLLDLSEPCIITIIDNDHILRRRSNAYRVRKELSEPEKQCQRYVSRYSRPNQVREDGWTVWGWPIHQADWKREILRSVVDEEAVD
jgi:hypothetical protein